MLLMDMGPEPRTTSPTQHCFPITSQEGEAHHLGGANRDLKTGSATVPVEAPKLPKIRCTGQLSQSIAIGSMFLTEESLREERENLGFY